MIYGPKHIPYVRNIAVCHECDRNNGGICQGDKKPITDNAGNLSCPMDYFPVKRAKSKTMTDVACGRCGSRYHTTDGCALPEGMTPEIAARAARQGGCCDQPRRQPD